MLIGSDHRSLISFGPMFCLKPSPSCKDMVRKYDDGFSFCNKKARAMDFREPTSPKVGCMGQIKRDKIGFSGTKYNKFVKLRKIFSAKNLAPEMSSRVQENSCAGVNIVEMDPPLPVPKRVVKDSGAVSLWQRRSRKTLESLQLQHRNLSPATI